MIHNLAKKNQSAETNSQIMQMLQVTSKTINSYNNHIPYIQENSRNTEHVRDMEDIKGVQSELLEMKIATSEIKNTLDKIDRSAIAKEKNSESDITAIQIIQNETHRKKRLVSYSLKISKPKESVSCGVTSDGLQYV